MAASLRKALISCQWQNCRRSRQVAKKCVQNHISAFSSCSSLHVEVQLQGVPQNLVEAKGETQTLLDIALQHKDYFGLKHLVTLRDLFNMEMMDFTTRSQSDYKKEHCSKAADLFSIYLDLTKAFNFFNRKVRARVHYGHNAGLRHESMTPYIYGCRQGTDIIDLEQTLSLLEQALNVCAHIVYRGGMVLFVCRNLQFLPWVEKTVRELGEYAHCRPWKRGIFTNAANIFNTLPIYPELCIFLGTQDTVFETHRAVVESNKLLIPSIGILDTNTDCASLITYPIPGNDDSPESLALYLHLFKTAILKAKEKRKQDGIVG